MIGSQGQGMYQAKYRFNWDAPIDISPHDPGIVYWGGNVVFRSRDYGHSWDIISPDLTTDDPEKQLDSGGEIYNDNTAAEFHTTILTIAESPVEAGVIWVGTDDGNVQITRDDGGTRRLDATPICRACRRRRGSARSTPRATAPARPSWRWTTTAWTTSRPTCGAATTTAQRCADLSAGLPQDDYVKVVREHPTQPESALRGHGAGPLRVVGRAATPGSTSAATCRGSRCATSRSSRAVQRPGHRHPRPRRLDPGRHRRRSRASPTPWRAALALFDVRRATRWESWSKDSNLG